MKHKKQDTSTSRRRVPLDNTAPTARVGALDKSHPEDWITGGSWQDAYGTPVPLWREALHGSQCTHREHMQLVNFTERVVKLEEEMTIPRSKTVQSSSVSRKQNKMKDSEIITNTKNFYRNGCSSQRPTKRRIKAKTERTK